MRARGKSTRPEAGGEIPRGLASRLVVMLGIAVLAVSFAMGTSASAASAASAWWHLTSTSTPGNLPPGGVGEIDIGASDIGNSPANGATVPIVISDTLPTGLKATAISGTYGLFSRSEAAAVPCSLASLSCEFKEEYPAFEHLEVRINVAVEAGAEAGTDNTASIAGGEATGTSVSRPVSVSGTPTPFGVERFEMAPENEGGSVDTQAGSHPYQITTSIALNQTSNHKADGEVAEPASLPKDLNFKLPAGLVGNASAVPQCTEQQFLKNAGNSVDACPAETAVGIASVTVSGVGLNNGGSSPNTEALPLFNLVPGRGEPARFGFFTFGIPVVLDTSVRTGDDYGVTVSVKNVEQEVGLLESQVTFWGVPEDPSHDASRGYECLDSGFFDEEEVCHPPADRQLKPLLTLPTSCPTSVHATLEADPWANPSDVVADPYTLQNSSGAPLGLEGCNHLPFSPSISVEPEAHSASSPTGLSVGVHLPQEADETTSGVSESDLKDTAMTLPQGVTLNPSAAFGLVGCSPAQIALESPGSGACPATSKVGTVTIKTPLLPNELTGAVYVASPQNFASGASENPFRSLVALYVVAEDPVSGVVVKLAGKVEPNETTGQLTTTFENTPQLPFEDLKLNFFGGARAPLSTPSSCGTYTSEASFTPYSGTAPVQSSSRLEIDSGAEGTGCPASRPFAPSFTAGTINDQADGYSPFSVTFSRRDQDQNLGAITVQTPPGLLGNLASVPLCGEAQANAGSCSAASQIGDTTTEAGVGSEPVTLPQAGEAPNLVYLTGPYGGQPFGLSFVVPAIAGPFNLGTVVVRASIAVNPSTSALTITSNPLPTMLQGIPLDIRTINVTVNRANFMFNPTDCAAQGINATIASSSGTPASVSSPFEATNCAALPFKPLFSVSTAGKASKAEGASLDVKLSSKGGPQSGGGEANIKSVKVDLPKQLPSRLTTLHKACLAAVFAANPASCPEESDVGSATAVTPVLAHPLIGPAYIVSHGGAAFPDLEIVLQGEGVKLILDGQTDIKKGITSSTFKTVPDAPITSFELKLPTGKYSILGTDLPQSAKYSFCGQGLAMPTEITGQNGAVVKQSTKIAVTGCPKAHKAKKHKRKKA